MKKFDNLEDLISEFRNELNQEEPDFGHFNRFDDKLNNLHKNAMPKKQMKNQTKWALLAASLISIFGLTMVINQFASGEKNNAKQTSYKIEQVNDEISETGREVFKQDAQFVSVDDQKQFLETTQSFTQLEMQYIELKQQFIEQQNEESLQAIKLNLEKRLSLLNDAMEKQNMDANKQLSHQSHLLTKATDCFGVPEADCEKYLGKQTSLYASY